MTTFSARLFTSVCGANPLRTLENRIKNDEAASRKQKKFPLAKQLGALLLLSVSRIESECRIAFRIVEV